MKRAAAIAALLAGIVLCAVLTPQDKPPEPSTPSVTQSALMLPSHTEQTPPATPELLSAGTTPEPDPWTDEDVEAIARTLSGECYEDKPQDKRLVAEVILNRVSAGRWGETVIEVITAKNQFHGYWQQSRDVSDNDREIAAQALRDWYANDCAALSEYLYFEAGSNRENVFRENY